MCVYYCSTCYKAVREGGGGGVEDMCYERLRAEAYVDIVHAGGCGYVVIMAGETETYSLEFREVARRVKRDKVPQNMPI